MCLAHICSAAVVKWVPLRICRSDPGLPCAQTLPPLRRRATWDVGCRSSGDGRVGGSDGFRTRLPCSGGNRWRVFRDLVGIGQQQPDGMVNGLGAAAT